mmetsp:Transcript_33048/g.65683  ORF Transcript_33048/g.65683 Transcript_33048/m.65683 type:complete len:253 (+) Transcript_33048:55-813(+)
MQRRILFATTMMISSSIRLVAASLSSSTSPFRGIGNTASRAVVFSRRRRVSSSPSSSTLWGLRSLRGGYEGNSTFSSTSTHATIGEFRSDTTTSGEGETKFVKLADPAPGSPFHYAFPVHSLSAAKHFYGTILGCSEGRSSSKWQDYSLHGHQIVCHWVGDNYRCIDYYNPVDGDEVPVPHAGLALTVEQFHDLAKRVREAGVDFIIEPHLRFEGMPGEQWTMFFKDPSGNNLEFKAMTKVENLFAKYNVED